MTLNRHLLFIIGAIVCFIVALLLALAVFSGGNQAAWVDGGLLSLALSFLP
jgi:hypothetical protein